jgi:chitodextrinase
MVKGTNHIFFDVSNTNFTITAGSSDTVAPTAPTLAASGTTQTTTNLSWSGATDNVAVTSYDVYRGTTLLGSTSSTTYAVSGLTASTTYSFTVIAKDSAGNSSVASNAVSVTTLAPVADTTAPTAPTLSASGTTQTTTNLSWSGATDNVAVTGYDVYRGTTFLGSTSSTTYAVSGLTASTTYSFTVIAKDAAGNVSVASNAVSVTTLAVATVTYCASQGNSTADEYINRVQLGTINNLSGNNSGYGNFTALSTNLVRGTSNSMTITPAWTGTVYSEGYRVWIDYNRDGDFADSGEQVVSVTKTKTTPITRSFTVPTTALIGSTRMRVSMKYNASPTYCETFSYGEVEDYMVNIVATARGEQEIVLEPVSKESFTLYPNPIKGDLVHIDAETQFTTYKILNLLGQVIAQGKIENKTVLVSNLASGTYLLEVSDNETSAVKRFIKQ